MQWLDVIKQVIDSKPMPPPAPTGITPNELLTPIWGIAERAVWGSIYSPPPPDPALAQASMAYDAKVSDLQSQITQLRIDKGVDDPEYLEAQRLFNVMFR